MQPRYLYRGNFEFLGVVEVISDSPQTPSTLLPFRFRFSSFYMRYIQEKGLLREVFR